jgi:hypothetical protein
MKARKRDSNDEWKDIAYVYCQLEDSYCLLSPDQMEFQHDTLSTELKTYNQVDEEKHWQNLRERAAIAIMGSLISHHVGKNIDGTLCLLSDGQYPTHPKEAAEIAIEYADALVKQLKGE